MDALELIENLERLDVKLISVETIDENSSVIADLNAAQMAKGKRSTGTDINPQYHPLTIELKKGRSGLAGVTDHVTLFDTGSFYHNMYAQVKGDEIEYGSKDFKSEKLEKKYGSTIFGLDEGSQEVLIDEFLQPSFYEKVHEVTGL
jgi:hypothetical protein